MKKSLFKKSLLKNFMFINYLPFNPRLRTYFWKLTTFPLNLDFSASKDAGQGLIDIGTGVGLTSNQANGTFLKLFIEVILPLILQIIGGLG